MTLILDLLYLFLEVSRTRLLHLLSTPMNKLLFPAKNRLSMVSFALLATTISSCSRPSIYKSNGAVSIFGVIYYILAFITILDIFKQPWSLLKKIIWTVVVLVPFGLILYYLISGRTKRN